MIILDIINKCICEISSIVIVLAFIKIIFNSRYGKSATNYMKNQFGIWCSSCIVVVFVFYAYYSIEKCLKIDSLYMGGIILIIFLGVGGILINKIYNLYFKSEISGYAPSSEEYLFIIFVSVIGVSMQMISDGIIGIFEPIVLLLGRLIWLDNKGLKDTEKQIKIDHVRIIETSILFLIGRCLISAYTYFVDGRNFIGIWGAMLYGLILYFPYNFVFQKIYEKKR